MHLIGLLVSDHKTVVDDVANGDSDAQDEGLQYVGYGHEHVDGVECVRIVDGIEDVVVAGGVVDIQANICKSIRERERGL